MGMKIIQEVPFLKPMLPMIYHHHEFINGSGYPDGIAGDAIPLGARVLTVSDAYDAMTSDRPYRKAMSKERGLEILESEKGKQFDAHMVDVFVELARSGKLDE